MLIMTSRVVVIAWYTVIIAITLKKQQFTDVQIMRQTFLLDAAFAEQWFAVMNSLVSIPLVHHREFRHK